MYTLQEPSEENAEDPSYTSDIIVISAGKYDNSIDADDGNVDSLECEETADKKAKLKRKAHMSGDNSNSKIFAVNRLHEDKLEASPATEFEDIDQLESSRKLGKNVI